MNLDRLLYTPTGQIILSIILGLGLATLFRKACTEKDCIDFHGPVISEFQDKVYKHGEKCYKYTVTPNKCDITKRIVDISEKSKDEPRI
uniref:Uncharacterized protein n=1 Tax=viral metagenome TaxID=1070528 RepID=A0A6C0I5A2_9ZZZZ